MTTATVRFWPRRKFCAPTLTEYFSEAASSAMRTRVFSLTSVLWLSARDTVETDTPASRAMSSICTFDGGTFDGSNLADGAFAVDVSSGSMGEFGGMDDCSFLKYCGFFNLA